MFYVKFCEFCVLPEFRYFFLFSVSRKTGDLILYTVLGYVGEIHLSHLYYNYAMLVRYMYLLRTVLCYVGEIHVSPVHCTMLCW